MPANPIAEQALAERHGVTPVWITLPEQARKDRPAGRCPYTGLKRSTLIDLCVSNRRNGWKPPVLSKLLKRKGSKRGIRLINLSSLLKHIETLKAD